MKKITTCILLLFSATISFCQQTNDGTKKSSIKKFYVQAGAGVTSSNGASIDFGIQAIWKSKWTGTISYQHIQIDPKNLPNNYEQGVTYVLFFPVYDEMPSNDMDILSVTIGKYFSSGKKTWFTTEAGLSFVKGQQFKFISQAVVTELFYLSSNYSFKEEAKTGFGGVVKADFNWAFLRYVGLGAGVYANFNSVQSPVGFELKLLVGRLNTKRKN